MTIQGTKRSAGGLETRRQFQDTNEVISVSYPDDNDDGNSSCGGDEEQ